MGQDDGIEYHKEAGQAVKVQYRNALQYGTPPPVWLEAANIALTVQSVVNQFKIKGSINQSYI